MNEQNANRARPLPKGSLPPGRLPVQTAARLKAEFPAVYEEMGVVGPAAESIGTTYDTIREWRNSDPEFNQACERARERFIQRLEVETIGDAFAGEKSPVYDRQGKPTGHHRTRKSDVLRMFFLKAWRPEVYKERYEIQPGAAAGDPPPPNLDNLTDDELREMARLEAKARGLPVPGETAVEEAPEGPESG